LDGEKMATKEDLNKKRDRLLNELKVINEQIDKKMIISSNVIQISDLSVSVLNASEITAILTGEFIKNG
jgi:hypothetical protein